MGEALFEQNDCERESEEDMRPIDEDMTPEVFANHDETPNKDDTGIRQCPIATPIPEKSRQDIKGDNEPIPICTGQIGEENQISHYGSNQRVNR